LKSQAGPSMQFRRVGYLRVYDVDISKDGLAAAFLSTGLYMPGMPYRSIGTPIPNHCVRRNPPLLCKFDKILVFHYPVTYVHFMYDSRRHILIIAYYQIAISNHAIMRFTRDCLPDKTRSPVACPIA
jgi:hypothetical protein